MSEQGYILAPDAWNEQDSKKFIDFGRYFVPSREEQLRIIGELIPPNVAPHHVVELCGGEGLLSRALLERDPWCHVHLFDGSEAMLERASSLLSRYRDRMDVHAFDLAARGWRQFAWPVHAAVSSLAIHHLDDSQKQVLFNDIAKALAPGGAFIIADLVRPTTRLGVGVAARLWDQAVQNQSLTLAGDLRAFEHFKETHWNYYSDPEPDPVDKPSPLLDQLKWLEQAGLVDVDVFWMNAGHAIFGGYKE
jgi:SAM-dependent methyltransferase